MEEGKKENNEIKNNNVFQYSFDAMRFKQSVSENKKKVKRLDKKIIEASRSFSFILSIFINRFHIHDDFIFCFSKILTVKTREPVVREEQI